MDGRYCSAIVGLVGEVKSMHCKVLKLHPTDNVALAMEPLSRGAKVEIDDGSYIQVRQPIPYGHKVALQVIPKGKCVLKYGYPIGRASEIIKPGDHVHVHNLVSSRGRGSVTTPTVTVAQGEGSESWIKKAAPSLNTQFLGFRRHDGRVGIRNYVLVLPTVHCANGVVEEIGRQVPEVIALSHVYGCSQLGKDREQTRRVLEAYANHPNVGAVLLIGLGCEQISADDLADSLKEKGMEVTYLVIQERGGSRSSVEYGIGIARELLQEVQKTNRELATVSELIVGVECGGSDAWSGVTANPAVGAAADLLVYHGGTVILSEVTEFIGAEQLLAARAMNPEISHQILEAVARREAVAKEMGVDLRGAQPSPGNIAGGLTTIEEKSLGAITKGGTTSIQEFLAYGESPSKHGLVIMDTAGNDLESVTGMVAGGAQLILFTTGRGTPVGNPIAPVIKIASNDETFKKMPDDIDINAGSILRGESIQQIGSHIFAELIDVANGKKTKAEITKNREFAIETIAPRV